MNYVFLLVLLEFTTNNHGTIKGKKGGEKTNNKPLLIAFAFLIAVMMTTPVFAAIGPTKVPLSKNKNLVNQAGNMVWMFNGGGVFSEWNSFESGVKYRLMRQSASKVNINCVDASDWTFPVNTSGVCFMMLVNAPTTWVYLNQTGMYNLLVGFGFPPAMAGPVSMGFPSDGVYHKANMIGNAIK